MLSGVLLAVLAGGCTAAPGDEGGKGGPVPSRPVLRGPSGVLLAAPAAEGREAENATVRVLTRLVRGTPQGGRIRVVGNSFSYVPLAEELVAAHRRGVDVQVLVDDVSEPWQAPAVLRAGLGADPSAGSFVRLARGGVHQKVWSFTRTGERRDVVLVGSMNLTYHSAGQYTDTRWWADRGVRRVLDRRFEVLLRTLPDPPPMPPARLGPDRVWFYPGYDRASDPVRAALASVPPEGARIRVAMYAWLDQRGLALADLLADLDAAGADVEVVLGRSVGPLVREVLDDSGVEVHEGVYDDGSDLHHKLTVVSHPDPDGPGRTGFVLTGSDNWTDRSLDRPEVLVRLGDRGRVLDTYERWIDGLVARAEREDG